LAGVLLLLLLLTERRAIQHRVAERKAPNIDTHNPTTLGTARGKGVANVSYTGQMQVAVLLFQQRRWDAPFSSRLPHLCQ